VSAVRIELLEKLVFGLAVLSIVLVAALVGVFSFVIQQSSGISKEEEAAAIEVDEWLTNARSIAQGGPALTKNIPMFVAGPAAGGGGGGTAVPGKPGAAPTSTAVPGQPDDYIAREGQTIPQEQQVPGIPWLKQQPGVAYMPPQSVPEVVYQRYQGFNEAYDVALQGAGEFVDGKYKITWVAPDSLLTTKIGIQPNDQIISVNGHPVGNSMNAGRQLYDSLKGEKRFAVKVLRNGREVVLSFFVN
jgi:hypothetical protein